MKTLVILVNFFSAFLTKQAVYSILNSESLGPVEIVVVDNSADASEANLLKKILPSEIKIIAASQNLGFGRACNLASEKSSSDCILLLNPDARLLPKALKRMQQTLFAFPRIAAVGPQVYWDDDLTFLLPPSYPPDLFLWQPVLDSWGDNGFFYNIVKALWMFFAIKVWRAKRPVSVPALSGGHMLLKTSLVKKGTDLFDPSFFMYFEDTDLCKRLRYHGYKLLVEPRAKVVHNYNQSGGPAFYDFKKACMIQSRDIYMEKHLTSRIRFFHRLLKNRWKTKRNLYVPYSFTSSFCIDISPELSKNWLFEWSPNVDFIPSAGSFGHGPVMEFSESLWNMLPPKQFYGRIGNPDIFLQKYNLFSWKKCG